MFFSSCMFMHVDAHVCAFSQKFSQKMNQLPPETGEEEGIQLLTLETFDAVYEANSQFHLHASSDAIAERYNKDVYEPRGQIRFRHLPYCCERLNCNYHILRTFKAPEVHIEFSGEGLYRRPDSCHSDLLWNDNVSQETKDMLLTKQSVVWQQVIICKGN